MIILADSNLLGHLMRRPDLHLLDHFFGGDETAWVGARARRHRLKPERLGRDVIQIVRLVEVR